MDIAYHPVRYAVDNGAAFERGLARKRPLSHSCQSSRFNALKSQLLNIRRACRASTRIFTFWPPLLAADWGLGTLASRQKEHVSPLITWVRGPDSGPPVADEKANRQLTQLSAKKRVIARVGREPWGNRACGRSAPARSMASQRAGVLAPPDLVAIDVPGAADLSHSAPRGVTRFEQRFGVAKDGSTGIAVRSA